MHGSYERTHFRGHTGPSHRKPALCAGEYGVKVREDHKGPGGRKEGFVPRNSRMVDSPTRVVGEVIPVEINGNKFVMGGKEIKLGRAFLDEGGINYAAILSRLADWLGVRRTMKVKSSTGSRKGDTIRILVPENSREEFWAWIGKPNMKPDGSVFVKVTDRELIEWLSGHFIPPREFGVSPGRLLNLHSK